MIKWQVGTKIACVKSFKGVNSFGVPVEFRPPQKGEIYTFDGVRGIHEMLGYPFIYLEEYQKITEKNRPTFIVTHFRPVDDIHKEMTEELVKELEEEMVEEFV